jgi:AcrR family transcriptional regulator
MLPAMSRRISAEQRRNDLVRAAIDVMSAEGLERATTRRIAEYAGASQASFHYAFRDKTELLTAVVDEVIDRWEAHLREELAPSRGVAETIRDSFRVSMDHVFDDDSYQLMQFELTLHCRRTPGLEPLAVRMYDRYLAVAVDVLDRACAADGRTITVGTEALARFVIAVNEGIILRYETTRDRDVAEADLDIAVGAALGLAGAG